MNHLPYNKLLSFLHNPLSKKLPGLRVYTYHGVIGINKLSHLERNFHTIAEFRQHIDFFRKKNVISLNDLSEIVNSGKKIEKDLVLITFDDGYANNLVAAEILKKYELPATFFVSTYYIGAQESIWTVNLSLLLLRGEAKIIEFDNERFSLETIEDRIKNFRIIRNSIKVKDRQDRFEACENITNQFRSGEIQRLLELYPYFKMMNWEEVINLASSGFSIQSHGHTHEMHHGNQSSVAIEEEIICSKTIIEEKLKNKCFAFAFPNGNFNEYSCSILKNNDYGLGFTTESGLNIDLGNNFTLSRLNPNRKILKMKNSYNSGE